MTLSYVWVTVASVVFLEALLIMALVLLDLFSIQIGSETSGGLEALGWLVLRISLTVTLIAAPIGGIFGLITTRGLVRRLRALTVTATHFANGRYEQRVPV